MSAFVRFGHNIHKRKFKLSIAENVYYELMLILANLAEILAVCQILHCTTRGDYELLTEHKKFGVYP